MSKDPPKIVLITAFVKGNLIISPVLSSNSEISSTEIIPEKTRSPLIEIVSIEIKLLPFSL